MNGTTPAENAARRVTGRGRFVFVTSVDLCARNGPSIHVLSLVNALAALGWTVVLAAPRPARPTVVALASAVETAWLPDARRLRLPGSAAFLAAAPVLWRERSADVIHVRCAPGSIVATRLARRIGRGTLSVELNGWIADEAAIQGYGGAITGRLARWQSEEVRTADRVRAVTARLAETAIAAGAAAERVGAIATGTDLDTFRPLDRRVCRELLGLRPGATYAVFLGNIWPAVDVDVMIDAVSRLRSQGRDIELLVIGDGVTNPRLQAAIARHAGLGHHIHRLGSKPPADANVVLGAADVAVAPFVVERNERIGLSPMKIRDYAAAGKTIAATDLPGIADQQGEPWLALSQPGSAAALAEAIAQALAADAAGAGAVARRFAEANFGWRAIAEQLSALVSPT